MKIKEIHIKNFKSIGELNINNPNRFSVFVGPNGAGKSNIIEAIEFSVYLNKILDPFQTVRLFKGMNSIFNYSIPLDRVTPNDWIMLNINSDTENLTGNLLNPIPFFNPSIIPTTESPFEKNKPSLSKAATDFANSFSRIFLNNESIKKLNIDDDSALNLDGSNLPKVLKRVLQDPVKRDEIIDWLQILIPEFRNIDIETANLSGEVNYVIYEKHIGKPFPQHLISDGSKNILALLVAVYQRDEPQFLCIEEPENGLHPYVIENLVSFFRDACKEKGHYIWLNTHSQTLVRQLTAEEIIVVEKEGQTKIRQFQNENLFGLKMDEAWLTNALGGGLP